MVGLGAIGGALGALVSEGFKVFKGHQDRKHELKLLDLQQKISKTETEREIAVTEVKSHTKMVLNAREHDIAIVGTSTWVNNLRASVRPIITYYAVIVATMFFFVGTPDIKLAVTSSFMLLMEAVIAFWFTGRMLKK